MQSIGAIEIDTYGKRKDIVSEKEDIKCSNILKQYKK